MKYIDAEKLIAEIERFSATEYGGNTLGDDVAKGALDYVLEEIIPSLQQEQPSLPSNLDEAAREWSEVFITEECKDACNYGFKAGAEWMAEQGWHEEAVIKGSDDVVWINYNVELPIDLAKYFEDGDKVIVQIRKK